MRFTISYFTKLLTILLSSGLLVGGCSVASPTSSYATSQVFPTEDDLESPVTQTAYPMADSDVETPDELEAPPTLIGFATPIYDNLPDSFILEIGPQDYFPIGLCQYYVSEGQFYWLDPPFDQITPVFNDQRFAYFDSTWSPSRQQFAYIRVDVSSYTESRPDDFTVRRDYPGDSIWIYSVEDGSTRQIGPLFTRWERMNVDGWQCEARPELMYLISWSPDEEWLLYVQYDYQGTNPDTFIINVRTSQLLDLGRTMWNYLWLPDSSGLLAVDEDSESIRRFLIEDEGWDPDFSLSFPPTISGSDWLPIIEWNRGLNSMIADAPHTEGNGFALWYLTDDTTWDEFHPMDNSNTFNLWEIGPQYAFFCTTESQTEQKEIIIYDINTWSILAEVSDDDFRCADLMWLDYQNGEAILILLRDSTGYSIDVYSISQGDFSLTAQLSLNSLDLIEYVPDLDIYFNLGIYRVK